MKDIIYNDLLNYFNTLSIKGYNNSRYKLLVLVFIKNLLLDYRGIIKEGQYNMIEKALYNIFGTSCLIPYPDYYKMGKLYVGNVSELAHKICKLQKQLDEKNNIDENVLAAASQYSERIKDNKDAIESIKNIRVIKPLQEVSTIPDIDI